MPQYVTFEPDTIANEFTREFYHKIVSKTNRVAETARKAYNPTKPPINIRFIKGVGFEAFVRPDPDYYDISISGAIPVLLIGLCDNIFLVQMFAHSSQFNALMTTQKNSNLSRIL